MRVHIRRTEQHNVHLKCGDGEGGNTTERLSQEKHSESGHIFWRSSHSFCLFTGFSLRRQCISSAKVKALRSAKLAKCPLHRVLWPALLHSLTIQQMNEVL